jgi:hypothetical protein
VLNEAIDALARRANRLADVVLDAVDRDAVDELTTLFACPPCANAACAKRGLSGDARAAKQWCHGPLAGGATAEEKRRGCADRGTDERRGEQVVLGVTRPPIPAVAAGLADAWAPLRANRYRRSHHRAPLTPGAARAA